MNSVFNNWAAMFDAVEDGTTADCDIISYRDVAAFAVEPLSDRFQFSLDGERIPTRTLYGEIHRGLGRFLTCL